MEIKKNVKKRRFLGKYDDQKIWWLRFLKTMLAAGVVIALVFLFIIGISHVSGSSMYPTLQNGQPVIFLRLGKEYKKGDIISARFPNGEYYVKRVVATAGDTVEIKDGYLYINGEKETGEYINGKTEEQTGVRYPLELKNGQFFLVGDNRENSVDSRTFGPIAVSQTRGKVLFAK